MQSFNLSDLLDNFLLGLRGKSYYQIVIIGLLEINLLQTQGLTDLDYIHNGLLVDL
jgi:hypothetical protein